MIRLLSSVMNQLMAPGVDGGQGVHSPQQTVSREITDSFKTFLAEALQKVNQQQIRAEQMTQQLVSGQAENLHDVMIAAEEAAISLQMAVQIRNKVVEAYQEIMRMQI